MQLLPLGCRCMLTQHVHGSKVGPAAEGLNFAVLLCLMAIDVCAVALTCRHSWYLPSSPHDIAAPHASILLKILPLHLPAEE